MPEINNSCVTSAWIEAVNLANASGRKEVSNLIVNICGLDTHERPEMADVRFALDVALEANGDRSVSTVSSTIFPKSLWRPTAPRSVLYERYLRLWPRIRAHRQNARGTYFQRLISYPTPSDSAFNQLEFVISTYLSGIHRRSALQCAILAPQVDLNATPLQGFPCMQQVAFIPEGRHGLRVSALYPMQYLWTRAYGNYMGLINLGRFMANEMGLELTGVTCVTLVAKLEKPSCAKALLEAIREL